MAMAALADCGYIHSWRDSTTSRNLIRINYVFMTDGDFNLVRTYAIGPGFSLTLSGGGAPTASKFSVHNTFHDYQPIVGDCLDSVGSWDGASVKTADLFTGYGSAAAMPGVNANLAPTNLTTVNDSSNPNPKIWVPTALNTNYSSDTNYGTGTIGTNVRRTANLGNLFWPLVLLGPKDASGFYQSMNLYTSNTTMLNNSIINEQDKLGMTDPTNNKRADFHRLILPLQIVDPIQNPARGTDFYLSKNGSPTSNVAGNDTAWSQQDSPSGITYYWLPHSYYQNYAAYYIWLYNQNKVPNAVKNLALIDQVMDDFPVGAYYTNHASTVLREIGLNGKEGTAPGSMYAANTTNHPYIFWPGNVLGYYSRSVCITDYYPDYTMVGDAMVKAKSLDFSSSNATASKWWNFKSKKWDTASMVTDSYWLADAQASVLRYKDATASAGYDGLPSGQNTTFYVIKYGSVSNNDINLKNMANDQINSTIYNSDQNSGQYFNVTSGNTTRQSQLLQQTFQQIAQQIAVRISK
jgi:hypothetical protein